MTDRIPVQNLLNRVGGCIERTIDINYDVATKTFHRVEWWSEMTCRGESCGDGTGDSDEVIPTTGELIDLLRKVRPDLADGLVVP